MVTGSSMMRSTPGFVASRLLRVLAAVAVAVVAASTLVAYEVVSRSSGASVAGEAKMQMLREEHALIAAYVASGDEARRLAYAAADNDIARMRLAAQGDARRQANIAAVEEEKTAPAAEATTVAQRTPERAAPARAVARYPAVAEPLQVVQSAALPAAQPAQQAVSDGPVRSRLRELASDVRRIPSLLESAVHWVADAVPAPKLPSLPMRRFSASI